MQQTIPVNDGSIASHVGSTPSTGPFAVDFPFFSLDDVVVTRLDDGLDPSLAVTLVRGADYSLVGVATEDGSFSSGTVTLVLPVANVTITRFRDTTIERLSNFPLQGFFSRLALNAELNRITAVLQEMETEDGEIHGEIRRLYERAIHIPTSDPLGIDTELSSAGSRAGKLLGFDGAGNVANYTTSPTGVPPLMPIFIIQGVTSGGVVDNAAIIQAALNTAAGEYWLLPGLYRCSVGITIPRGVTLRGFDFLPENPPNNYGTVLLFDNAVPVGVTLAAGPLFTCSLREIVVSRAGPTPPAGSIGIFVNSGYNIDLTHVMAYNHAIGFKFLSVSVGGLGSHCNNLYTGAISENHLLYDTWTELYVTNSRFGMNGGGNFACNAYIRVQGGNPGSGAGPNSLHFTNCQFNQGTNSPGYFFDFGGIIGTIGGSPNTDASEFKFTSCHIEGVATAYFRTDATVNRFLGLFAAGCEFHSPGVPFMALNTATQPWAWHIVGNEINGPLTLAPTAPIVSVFFTNNDFNGNVSLTGAAGSFASFVGNSMGNVTLAGSWLSLEFTGEAGTLTNTAAGNLSIDLPATPFGTVQGSVGTGSQEMVRYVAYNATPANNDGAYYTTSITNSAGVVKEAVRRTEFMSTVASGSETSQVYWNLLNLGAVKATVVMTPSVLGSVIDGSMALGTTGLRWNSLALGGSGFIDFGGTATVSFAGSDIVFNGGVQVGSGIIKSAVTVVASLPSASPPGQRAVVGDATVNTFGTVVAGGGSNTVPVYSAGGTWLIG